MGIGLAAPKALKPVYLAWMSVATVLGFLASQLILTLFFFVVITPIGLLARLSGKDFLSLKLDRQAPSYWLRREPHPPKSPADYERQF
jgi:hypothetical protein